MRTSATASSPSPVASQRQLASAAAHAALLVAGIVGLYALLAAAAVDRAAAPALLLVAGAAVVCLAFRFAFQLACCFPVFTSSLFHEDFFAMHLGPAKIGPHEAILSLLLLVALVRPRRRTLGGTAGFALAAFLGVVLLTTFIAIATGRTDPAAALAWGRSFYLLTFFYVVVRLFPDAETRNRLLTVCAVLGAITGVVALAVALGSPLGPVLQDSGHQFIRDKEGMGSLKRVRLPGLALSYGLFWFTVVRLLGARGLKRLGWSAVLLGSMLNVVVSFNRNMWLGLVVGLALMLVLAGARFRGRLLAALATVVAAIALTVFAGPRLADTTRIEPLVKRGTSVLSPQSVTEEKSITARERETRLALIAVRHRLLLGHGAGATYGMFFDEARGDGRFVSTPQAFLHNQYLYLVLVGGIPGLLLFLAFLGTAVRTAWHRTARRPGLVACGVGIAMIMLSASVMLYFTQPDMTATLAMMAGCIVASAGPRRRRGDA